MSDEKDINLISKYIAKHRTAPRNIQLAAAFISPKITNKKIALYGAGSHSEALLTELLNRKIPFNHTATIDYSYTNNFYGKPTIKPSELHQLANETDLIVVAHQDYEHAMLAEIYKSKIEIPVLSVYENPSYKEFSKSLHNDSTQKKHMLPVGIIVSTEREITHPTAFNSLRNKYHIIKILFGRSGSCLQPESYDEVIQLHQSVTLLEQTIHATKPKFIYVQDHYSRGNILAAHLKSTFPKITVFGEFYDILHFMFDNPYLLSSEHCYQDEDINTILAGERMASHLDGVITKERGNELTKILPKDKTYYSGTYIPRKHWDYKNNTNENISIVYAGSLISQTYSSKLFGDNHLLDIFKKWLALGISVHLYFDKPDMISIQRLYPEYLELALHTSNFHTHTRIPREKLIKEISKHTFGVQFGSFSPQTLQESQIRIKTTMPQKIYTYMAAGLPVILNKELTQATDFVEQNGIGIGITKAEDILKISHDQYASFKKNLVNCVDKYSLESKQKELMEYLESTIDKTTFCTNPTSKNNNINRRK